MIHSNVSVANLKCKCLQIIKCTNNIYFLAIPDKCLLDCVFYIVEYDQYPKSSIFNVPTWKKIILRHGGIIESSYSIRLTHILCQTQKHPFVQLVFKIKAVFVLIILSLNIVFRVYKRAKDV